MEFVILFFYELRRKNELFITIKASDIDDPRCPHANSAARANILPCAGLFIKSAVFGACPERRSRTRETVDNGIDTAKADFGEIVFYTEFQEQIGR